MVASVMLIDSSHVVNREFDYTIPEELISTIVPGLRVLVPFGVRNGTAEAIVLAIKETSEYPNLKSLICALDCTPVCSPELLTLCKRMEQWYFCSFQHAYKLMKPPHMGTKIRQWVKATGIEPEKKLSPAQTAFLDTLRQLDNAAELEELAAEMGKKSIVKTAFSLQDMELIEIHEQIDAIGDFAYVRKAHLEPSPEDGYLIADELRSKRATVQADMILALCDNGDMTTADLVMVTDGNYTSLNALRDKGILTIYREQVDRKVYEPQAASSSAYTPTEEQQPIINHLREQILSETHEKILLHGVTGSGKTEVFLQAIDTCLKQGKQAIMLVPEISLTPQMVARFVGRFGASVAVIHSGLSQGERFDQWHKIKHGEVNVVVGARSAVFAPFDNIGIIILDEEHESSYKSETTPRYHAREIAFWRGQRHNAPVLLASATPAISSYYHAKEGRYRLFEMHKRYNEGALPKARIADMRSELLDYHNTSAISIRLQDELRRNLEKGEKSILFLNRRGYNTFVSCRECGYVMECEHCSIALTYHRKTDKLVCHYCGFSIDNIDACPSCGSKYVKFFGTGTQKIEDELHTLFPEAKILRMDFDTTSGKGSHERILRQFQNGNADILLGTQMVTKGLDFPQVTLVGVLAADASLNVDDFRAGERCFSLITQVCGRAGRGDLEGRAVIQTYQPDNSTIQFAKSQDYIAFYENEILYRKRMEYPPYCDMIYLLLSGEDADAVHREMGEIAAFLKNGNAKDSIAVFLGPAPAPIAKIKNNFRDRLLLKTYDVKGLFPYLHRIHQWHQEQKSKNTLTIDINPINMI